MIEQVSIGVDGPRYVQLCKYIGQLIISFASLEGTLATRLKVHLARNIDPDDSKEVALGISAAIFGSMRFKNARDTMKRIMAAEHTDTRVNDFILGIFEQVGQIEGLRDRIAHQQMTPSRAQGAHWGLTDIFTTRDTSSIKTFVFHTDIVKFAYADLRLASRRIGYSPIDESRKLFSEKDFDFSPIAWQYKSSMLKLLP